MNPSRDYDLVAIGGGTAGLIAAMGAAHLGARSAIIEVAALGGDCLWTGCVPSKALIASARVAQTMRRAEELGLVGASPAHAFRSVMERTRAARDVVARHDDPERIRASGVDIHFGKARFEGPDSIDVEGVGRVRSKRFVLATGARPTTPPVPGLRDVLYLTHETAFEQDELPPSLIVLGGGPVGLEFAQVYARLGSQVTVVEREDTLLGSEDPDVRRILHDCLVGEGIRIQTGVEVTGVAATACGVVANVLDGVPIEAAGLFVATGRHPATKGLDLERADVALDRSAVRIDRRQKTTGRSIWAAGDVTGGPQFTHAAEAAAKAVVQNALFPVPTQVDPTMIPRVTYTDPEVAHIGISHLEASERGAKVYVYDFSHLDRAITDADTRGMVKISADRKGRILAASIVGSQAGELILPLVMARQHGLTLSQISATTFPYPTRMEGLKRAANAFQRSRLEGPGGRLLKRWVSWFS